MRDLFQNCISICFKIFCFIQSKTSIASKKTGLTKTIVPSSKYSTVTALQRSCQKGFIKTTCKTKLCWNVLIILQTTSSSILWNENFCIFLNFKVFSCFRCSTSPFPCIITSLNMSEDQKSST